MNQKVIFICLGLIFLFGFILMIIVRSYDGKIFKLLGRLLNSSKTEFGPIFIEIRLHTDRLLLKYLQN